MANLDTTREFNDVDKRYVGARMQQGRSLLDTDWNEDARLRADDLRQTFADLVGPQGSSNEGFKVINLETFVHVELATTSGTPVFTYDFELHPGSLWTGGLRVTTEGDETFLRQADFLQLTRDPANLPIQPTAAELLGPPKDGTSYSYETGLVSAKRYDLVYLETWEQPITAIEDTELRERALGGADTSVRVRRMRRVHVLPDVKTDNLQVSLLALLSKIAYTTEGDVVHVVATPSGTTYGTTSNARLTVTPVTETSDQPCGPAPVTGYTGHEDQAIRVELRGPTSIVWGFGNAAPLYRARVGSGSVVTLLNRPRDPRRYPQAGQIAELIASSSQLANGETAADLTGDLVRIGTAYDPATGEFELSERPSDELLAWLESTGVDGGGTDVQPSFVYVRIWDRGPDIGSNPLLDASSSPVKIGYTGLQITLGGAGQSGDYWIIAARRATPDSQSPWELHDAAPPLGLKRFYAPLALLTWEAPLQLLTANERNELEPGTFIEVAYGGTSVDPGSEIAAVYGPVVARVQDVRRVIAPLSQVGLSTITVGDGKTSNGMVNSIAKAATLLPPEGGRIHLLSGEHIIPDMQPLVLARLNRVTIHGTGLNCRVRAESVVSSDANLYTQGDPLITLQKCLELVLEDFVIVGNRAVGIRIETVDDVDNQQITLRRLRFEMDGTASNPNYAFAQAAVLALGCERLCIEGCYIHYTNNLNITPALVLGGRRITVRDNTVLVGTPDDEDVALSMGGVQILGFSRDVELSGNLIQGGWGDGIVLGHALDINDLGTPPDPFTSTDSWEGLSRMHGDVVSNTLGYVLDELGAATSGSSAAWSPGGPLAYVSVHDNRICNKGMSGISTGGFFDSQDASGPRYTVVVNLEIRRNEIVGNMQLTDLGTSAFSNYDVVAGGVALAAAMYVRIRENIIRNNGATYDTPLVGIGMITAQSVAIQGNVIANNGVEDTTAINAPGLRGGIAMFEVTSAHSYTFPDAHPDLTMDELGFPSFDSSVALAVRKNEVYHPHGKTLFVMWGFGPIVVTGNSLHGLGDPVLGNEIPDSLLTWREGELSYAAQGACVEIRNYAISPHVTYSGSTPQASRGDTSGATFMNGAIDFTDNDVSLSWSKAGGYPASVLLSSFDSVKVTDNVMSVVMGNTTYPNVAAFDTQLQSDPSGDSFVLVNCWAGAASTVQASGNRFTEPVWDCLFSYLGAHAASFGGGTAELSWTTLANAGLATSNTGTHCVLTASPAAVSGEENIAIFEFVSGCAPTVGISSVSDDQVVNIQLLIE